MLISLYITGSEEQDRQTVRPTRHAGYRRNGSAAQCRGSVITIANYPPGSRGEEGGARPNPPPSFHHLPLSDQEAISHRATDLCLAYHEVDVLVVTVRLIAGGQRQDEH